MNQTKEHIHFVTGRLAEHAVRYQVDQVAEMIAADVSISVLPITVAALMTPKWLMRHLDVPSTATRVILPGHLTNDVDAIRENYNVPIDCGPRDIRDLPKFFGRKSPDREGYGDHSIEIIAEINHASQLTLDQLKTTATKLLQDGADYIDLGCSPGRSWATVGEAVKLLIDLGAKVSIDSFDPKEVADACRAGASLVLSVNSTNRAAAVDWDAEVVVVPDVPDDKKSFQETIEFLSQQHVPMRLDPILEPIGFGVTKSLLRYAWCREQYPDAIMMMGIGNITELTDVDSAGVNVMLLGICQELGIQSVLTTEVINWARTSVKECALARQLVHFACENRVPPKHLEPDLVMLRDERLNEFPFETIQGIGAAIKDKNVRIFISSGAIHALSAQTHVYGSDPYRVMQDLLDSPIGESITPGHAGYLGYELAKAKTAITLGKQYEQDQPLNWGFLTEKEEPHRIERRKRD